MLKIVYTRNWFGRFLEKLGILKPIWLKLDFPEGQMKVSAGTPDLISKIRIETGAVEQYIKTDFFSQQPKPQVKLPDNENERHVMLLVMALRGLRPEKIAALCKDLFDRINPELRKVIVSGYIPSDVLAAMIHVNKQYVEGHDLIAAISHLRAVMGAYGINWEQPKEFDENATLEQLLGLPADVPIIDMDDADFKEKYDFNLWSVHSSSDYRNDRERPYNGQMHTDEGLRGKQEVRGLTMRDISDCFIMGLLESSVSEKYLEPDIFSKCWDFSTEPPTPTPFLIEHQNEPDFVSTKVELGTWRIQDVYKVNFDRIDPLAVVRNMTNHIEKMMGIFPNISPLKEKNN